MIGTSKPFFNILLDDRAGLHSACLELKGIIEYVISKLYGGKAS